MSTADMTICHVAPSGNIITPKGRLSYAQYLLEPQENQSGKLVHNLNILIPKDSNLKTLKEEMAKIALDKLDGDKTRTKNMVEKRFLDPNDLPGGGKPMGPEFADFVLVRASAQHAPKFAYPNGKAVPDEQKANEVYSGRWARATLNPYWSGNKKNPGVFLGLQNIQLLDHDENLGVAIPNAEDEFEAVGDYDESQGSEEATSDVDEMFG